MRFPTVTSRLAGIALSMALIANLNATASQSWPESDLSPTILEIIMPAADVEP